MGLDRLKSVISLVADSTIVELKFSEGDTHISLVRRVDGGCGGKTDTKAASRPDAQVPMGEIPVPSARRPAPEQGGAASPSQTTARQEGDFVVLAPMASIFHRSPSPMAAPFIEVGDRCEPGTKLCILEAMKIFTMLDAECGGTIAEFYVNDGEEVQIDQPLIRIRRSDA